METQIGTIAGISGHPMSGLWQLQFKEGSDKRSAVQGNNVKTEPDTRGKPEAAKNSFKEGPAR